MDVLQSCVYDGSLEILQGLKNNQGNVGLEADERQ